MSRIGNAPIEIPSGVEVNIEGRTINVKGPKGELSYTCEKGISAKLEENVLTFSRANEETQTVAFHGLARALANNMVIGVSQGFEKKLQLVGVGYRAAVKGRDLELSVGYSHPVKVVCPEGITFACPSQEEIIVTGYDKQAVGEIAAYIRKQRPPEPYKGKGIRYEGEHVRRKLGKAAKSE